MTTILFCGDTHGQFDHVVEAVRVYKPAAVILLGDLQAQQPLEAVLAPILPETNVWFIHGNHDTDSDADYDNLFQSQRWRIATCMVRIVEIAGLRIAGIGGVFRGQVWAPPIAPVFRSCREYLAHGGKSNRWRGGLPRKHRSTIFPDDYFALAKQHADVLVTHGAPSCHPHGFEAIDELARSLAVGKVLPMAITTTA